MVQLEELESGCIVEGLDTHRVEIIGTKALSPNNYAVYYKVADGATRERVIGRSDAEALRIITAQNEDTSLEKWSFDADGDEYKLVNEAIRLHMAHLFDPYLAIQTSLIDPLPHQVEAVYDHLLKNQPLRFLLADDPGAGKTIMTGLYLKELFFRGDLERCLIVAPGSLVPNWQEELSTKFGLEFPELTRDMIKAVGRKNVFNEHPLLLARLDMVSRDSALKAMLTDASEYDLIVVDEAHKMSASYQNGRLRTTLRYELGQELSRNCRNFLLLTATPHNGHTEDYHAFLALLDEDQFSGQYREGIHETNTEDRMRRVVKEGLTDFEGNSLFPQRFAYTHEFDLSGPELGLYDAVTDYVRDQMQTLSQIEGTDSRQSTVGFALTVLQRRLASSPYAIHRSLRNRRQRLRAILNDQRRDEILAQHGLGGESPEPPISVVTTDSDSATSQEVEDLEESMVNSATASNSRKALEQEIEVLDQLEHQALQVIESGIDSKWRSLEALLQSDKMVDERGNRRKFLVFSEHRDTVEYLVEKIQQTLGEDVHVEFIHGDVSTEERYRIQAAFQNDHKTNCIVATDAAGEGINLQRGSMLINYDLPWNPNRLEQRFGRIHRIGSKQACHMFNMVSPSTREGQVFQALLEKIAQQNHSLEGRVFDVLGELMPEKDFRQLVIDAITEIDVDSRMRRVHAGLGQVNVERARELTEQEGLEPTVVDPSAVQRHRVEMERARNTKLQPQYVEGFFLDAFRKLGGIIRPVDGEPGRYEIQYVPQAVRQAAKAANPKHSVASSYQRIAFDRQFVAPPGVLRAAFIVPGHPLLDGVIAAVLETLGTLAARGAILVDEENRQVEPRILVNLETRIQDGTTNPRGAANIVHHEMKSVEVAFNGKISPMGPAPYLDYKVMDKQELNEFLAAFRFEAAPRDWESQLMAYAADEVLPQQLDDVRASIEHRLDRELLKARQRLVKEISLAESRKDVALEQEARGEAPAGVNSIRFRERAELLRNRLRERKKLNERQRDLSPLPPAVHHVCLVIPRLKLLEWRNEKGRAEAAAAEQASTQESNLRAMRAVHEYELARGNETRATDHIKNLGWDIEVTADPHGKPRLFFVEVKGYKTGSQSISLEASQVRAALNNPGRFVIALVELVAGGQPKALYVRSPWAPSEVVLPMSDYGLVVPLSDLLQKAQDPAQALDAMGADEQEETVANGA